MALTTFPLLPRGQDWTQQIAILPQHAHRVFGSDIMEGVYLASRFLTTDDQSGGNPACGNNLLSKTRSDLPHRIDRTKRDIPDYAQPFWDRDPNHGRTSDMVIGDWTGRILAACDLKNPVRATALAGSEPGARNNGGRSR